ncbi:MAG: discoidin domain-containing protein, partial [Planctomycetes bacterium]|nr:discoidin domain-containing protein [Planctomycetota bacterium]
MTKTCLMQCVLVFQMTLTCSAVTSPSSMVEADWAWQFAHREPAFQVMNTTTQSNAILPTEDAAGACDGLKTGTFGFHTAFEDNPWWQVDLERTCDLGRIIVTNRGDGFADRAARLTLSVATVAHEFSQVYQHDGTVFSGQGKGAPLTVDLTGTRARWLRIQVPGPSYFHLDEVEVYGKNNPENNLALGKPAAQSSVSEWSTRLSGRSGPVDIKRVIDRGLGLVDHLAAQGVAVDQYRKPLAKMQRQAEAGEFSDPERLAAIYPAVRRITRALTFQNPVLDFDSVLFVKRKPSMFPHLSDQYYGWWSRPGGGIYVLKRFKHKTPDLTCLTEDWAEG